MEETQKLHVRAQLLRYGSAALSIALAVWIRLLLDPAIGNQFPYATLFFGVLLAAAYGGFGPGLFAVVLGTFSADYFLLPPRGSFRLVGKDQMVGIALFIATSVGIAVLGGLLRAAKLRAEASSRAAQHKATLIDQTFDAILVWNWNGPITFWNQGAERIYGFSAAEATGRISHELFGTQTSDGVEGLVGTLERDGVWEGELEQSTRDGRRVVMESRMVLIRQSKGAYVLEINRDITRRKKAEAEAQDATDHLETRVKERTTELQEAIEALHETDQRLRLLVSGVKDYAILMLDTQGHIITWNHGAETIKGYRAEEILGKHFSIFYPPEDVADGKPERELKVAAAEGNYHEEGWRVRKDGSRFWAHVLITAMRDQHGELRGFSKVSRDMTAPRREEAAVKEAQARMAGIINSAMDAIISIDQEQNIVLFNAAAERMFRCPAETALGQSIERFVPEQFRSNHHQHVQEFGSTGVTSRSMGALGALSGLRADGEVFPIEASISQLDVAGGTQYTVILRDISDRKRAEADLRESQARLAGLIDTAMDAIVSIDDAQRIVLFNAAAEKMFRCPASDALGQSLERFIPLRHRSEHSQHVRGFGMLGVTSRSMGALGALSGLRSDGEEFPIEASISQLEVAGQKQYTVILRDITDRKRAEESLRKSEAQLQTIVESLDEGVVVSDLTGKLLRFNRAALAVHGFASLDECLRLEPEFADTFELRRLDGTALPLDQWPVSRILRGEILRDMEVDIRRIHQDWQRIFNYGGALVHDAAGQPLMAVITIDDITNRKRAEESLRKSEAQLQTVFESLEEGVAVFDLKGKLIHCNAARLKLLGFSNHDEGLNHIRDFQDAFEFRDMDGTLLPVEGWPLSKILGGQRLADREVRLRSLPGGWEKVFNFSGRLVHNPEGQPLMAVLTMSDITERKRAAEEILKLNTELEQRVAERTVQLQAANQELEAFSYSVSHDLRAPLRAVDGFSQSLLEDFGPQLPEQGHHYLRTIRQGAQRMGALIDDLLAFSKLGRQSLRKRTVDVDSLVREILEELAGQMEGRQVEVRIGELPRCQGDQALLKQVWINLLSNALKYSRKRERALVEVGSLHEQGVTVYFVRDNGTGFDMRYAHKLFGVFQRLHLAEDFEGTGVGLAIVQRVVNRHGGRIWAEAEVDRGATFHFTLEGDTKG